MQCKITFLLNKLVKVSLNWCEGQAKEPLFNCTSIADWGLGLIKFRLAYSSIMLPKSLKMLHYLVAF